MLHHDDNLHLDIISDDQILLNPAVEKRSQGLGIVESNETFEIGR